MLTWSQWKRRLRALANRGTVERELDDELRFHIEMETELNMKQGMAPDEARRVAERDFGGVERIRDDTRDTRGVSWIEDSVRDVRVALRGLVRQPAFTIVALLTLGLGIGANTAIFSVVNGVVLQPLGYPNPEQLVMITSQFPALKFDQFWVSPPEYLEFSERNKSFSSVGAYAIGAVNIGSQTEPIRVPSASVTSSMFDVLAVKPLAGRTFTREETVPNGPDVVVLSHEIWTSAFGADPKVVGRQVEIDARKRTVVGVMPPGFDLRDQGVRVWLPLQIDPAQRTQNRGSHFLYLIGRRKPEISLNAAKAEMSRLVALWVEASGGSRNPAPGQGIHAPSPKNHPMRMDDLQKDVVGSASKAIWVLQAAVGFVLLIACANMANLLLMRAESRHKELAVRVALGAGRGRLIRQFMAEGILLSLSGAVLGIGLAHWILRGLIAANASSIPRASDVGLDPTVLVFTLLVAIGTGLLFGAAPLLNLSARNTSITLRDSGSRTTATAARHRVRRSLVVTEMALAVVLVVGAGLMMRTFWNLMSVDSGFDRRNLSTFNVVLPAQKYADSTARVAFFDRLMAKLDAIPGVDAATAMTGLPPRRNVNANDTDFEGVEETADSPAQNIDYYQYVEPNYFATMQIGMVSGRPFNASDIGGAPPVAIINESAAKLFYPKTSPIGRRIRPSGNQVWFTIVGVAKDVKQGGVNERTGTELYLSVPQAPLAIGFAPRNMNVVMRTPLEPSVLARSVRKAVSELDAGLPIVSFRTMEAVFSDAVSRQRFIAQLMAIFATVALMLAAIGTYGVLAYSVTERRREIGIRMALGANTSGVMSMIVRQGAGLASIGIAAGIVGALALSKLASTLLFGVKPTDPLTLIAVSVTMLAVALTACAVPARRATRVDPLVALRAD